MIKRTKQMNEWKASVDSFVVVELESSGRIQSNENVMWKGKHPHRPQNHRSMTWKMKTKCILCYWGIFICTISRIRHVLFSFFGGVNGKVQKSWHSTAISRHGCAVWKNVVRHSTYSHICRSQPIMLSTSLD